jgi:LPS biosynthesis protein, putative
MGALYKSVNISIIPSYYEGLGFTAIESLAASLPTIVSNTSGLDEIGINGYNCLTVEPRNSRSLADAIIRLLGDDKLQDKLMNNATSSIEKFDMRFFVDYIEDEYKKVARLC